MTTDPEPEIPLVLTHWRGDLADAQAVEIYALSHEAAEAVALTTKTPDCPDCLSRVQVWQTRTPVAAVIVKITHAPTCPLLATFPDTITRTEPEEDSP